MAQRKTYYFIGIGGIGMSALAKILVEKGHKVLGSDHCQSMTTSALKNLGVFIDATQTGRYLTPGMEVVYSSAIHAEHPELIRAKQLNLPLHHRSDMLDILMRRSRPCLITGAHGKTSTTAMLASLLLHAGYDPSFVVGGYIKHLMTNACAGKGDIFVAEADESDGSFLRTPAYAAIVTNTEADHLDYWGDHQKLLQGYQKFIDQVKNKDLLFLCDEDPFLSNLRIKAEYYGFSKKATLQIVKVVYENFATYFDISFQGQVYEHIFLPMQGRHQVLNAAAAFGLALKLGAKQELLRYALQNYQGVKRRLELVGELGHIQVFDDYAHHPTEIEATLKALRQALPHKRIVAIFQPHRYTRLQHHMNDFAKAFKDADMCVITEVYSAGEPLIPHVNEEKLLSVMEHACALKVKKNELVDRLVTMLKDQDVVVTLGAGDITYYGAYILERLKTTHEKFFTT